VNAAILFLLALALGWSLTGVYWKIMIACRRLEPPSDRGMHSVPVPTGAGAAIVASVLLLWPLWQTPTVGRDFVLMTTLAAIALISWLDDRDGLAPTLRLVTHATAVGLLLASSGAEFRLLPEMPLAGERLVLGLAWLWFINLFNFMDGIDGLAGTEAVAVGAGYVVVVTVAGAGNPLDQLAITLAAAAAGYLFWNWHPAKVFMGDTGSITLGFLLGWLMVDLTWRGLWAAALILPLYFVADATLTLAMRLLRGEKLWEPHRQHAYQRAVLRGAAPSAVVMRAATANAMLVMFALFSIRYPVLAIVGSSVVVTGLMINLDGLGAGRPPRR
jgi:UDP-N-acetylmuramyl pentapeptide phosphotransferase/UDP-N-acetylglucosamine-1-phosphate transferase